MGVITLYVCTYNAVRARKLGVEALIDRYKPLPSWPPPSEPTARCPTSCMLWSNPSLEKKSSKSTYTSNHDSVLNPQLERPLRSIGNHKARNSRPSPSSAKMENPLQFSRTTYAKLSPHPLLLTTLSPSDDSSAPSTRTNGRSPSDARPVHIHTESLSHAHGSAVVRTGNTTAICGIRGEILPVTSIPQYRPADASSAAAASQSEEDKRRDGARELRDYDLLVPNIELATGCAPQFLPGVPPSTMAQTLSTRVYSLLHKCRLINIDDLKIWNTPAKMVAEEAAGSDDEGEDVEEPPELMAYWVLYIDILFISYDGNPFDAAWAAVIAALQNTKLPSAKWSVDQEMVVCSRKQNKELSIVGFPIACTATVFLEKERSKGGKGGSKWLLVDPDSQEESLCKETLTMVVDRIKGNLRVHGIEKLGGVTLGPRELESFGVLAERRWGDMRNAVKEDFLVKEKIRHRK
jgi:exosome complex component RRP43